MNGPIPLQDYEGLYVVTKARNASDLSPEDLPDIDWARCDLIEFTVVGDTCVFLVGSRKEIRPKIGRSAMSG
ncbi:MAG: hypothetical protein HY701_03285 [Gemmatimonadetes bacterium]|nr:hypothetical protein [Gemmatimonadota bacterium]